MYSRTVSRKVKVIQLGQTPGNFNVDALLEITRTYRPCLTDITPVLFFDPSRSDSFRKVFVETEAKNGKGAPQQIIHIRLVNACPTSISNSNLKNMTGKSSCLFKYHTFFRSARTYFPNNDSLANSFLVSVIFRHGAEWSYSLPIQITNP